jgi:hypothetical protein
MDWFDLFTKGLIAIAAIAGAITAFFTWHSRRKAPDRSSPETLSSDRDNNISVAAGRDINIVKNSFNRLIGGKDGR